MKKLIMMIGLVLGSVMLHAQTNYAVMVTDSKTAKPIVGAAIKIKSTRQVLNTSESGNVVVLVSNTDSLHIQSRGYRDRKISMVNQPLAILILMDPQPKVVTPKSKKKNH